MSRGNNVPDYPGRINIEPPKPPKYLVKQSDDRTEIIKVNHGAKASAKDSRPNNNSPMKFIQPDPNSRPLINTKISMIESQEKVPGPPHRYRSKVDSMNDAKDAKGGYGFGGPGGPGLSSNGSRILSPPPSRDIRMLSKPPGAPIPLPQVAALRRFEPPLISTDYAGGFMISKRTAGGTILGSPTRRYVQEQHVPHWDGEEGYDNIINSSMSKSDDVSTELIVGPENPVVPYNANVSQCWDDEAGAVYYYNHSSGEASWLPPEA